jgi:AcrR family transcriptional regulator
MVVSLTVTKGGKLFMKKIKNTQNVLVKDWIFSALMLLMQKKPFQEITITEITNKAGVSRMAYYRNYKSKEDIIITYLDELFEEYSQELLAHKSNDPYKNARLFFAYFRKHAIFLKNLINSNLTFLILERFDSYLYALFKGPFSSNAYSPAEEKYTIAYTAGGIYKILLTWAKDGFHESDEKMATIITNLLR